jgi:hypothetical protein
MQTLKLFKMSFLLIVLSFLVSSCYTQLALVDTHKTNRVVVTEERLCTS